MILDRMTDLELAEEHFYNAEEKKRWIEFKRAQAAII